ncbi:hypothetical protein ABIA45_002913 [Bradyrhizobium sp. USDA 336]
MSMRFYVSRDAGAVAVGADEVALALEQAAARRGVAIEIVRTGSRGMYWLEPLVEVATPQGRIAFGPVAEADVPSLLDALANNTPHLLRLGATDEIPWLKRQTRLTFARCGVIDPRSLDDYRGHGGYQGLARALSLGSDAILTEVTASGLRGRGGAGFPTGIKWKTVAQAKADRKFIVCNADEGDSGTFADRMIMEGDPFLVIEGMTIAGLTVGATKGYIYIRSEYPHAVEAMNVAIQAAKRGGYLGDKIGGSKQTFDLEVRVGAGAYVCGEEIPRCWRASKAAAASCAPSRRCRPITACSASPPSSTTCCRSRPSPSSLPRGPRPMRISAWAARAARCRSSSRATSATVACSRPPSV